MVDYLAAPAPDPVHEGWFIVVTIPKVGIGRAEELHYMTAIPDADAAERAVRKELGSLYCKIEVRFRMSARALANSGVPAGGVKLVGHCLQ